MGFDRSRPLAEKVAIVTGAAGGIGGTLAHVLADCGAQVVVTDLPGSSDRRPPIADVAQELTQQGLQAAPFAADLVDEDDVEALIGFAAERFGGLDVVVNNAAPLSLNTRDLDVASMPISLWEASMAGNLRTQMLVCKHAIPRLAARGGGSIVNMSSGLALRGDYHAAAYSAAKAAILQLTRHIATTYGSQGIRCNAALPGVIETAFDDPDPMLQAYADHNPMRRLGRPQDVADLVAFLASDAAGYINGQAICVDGGLMVQAPTAVVAQFLSPDTP